MTQNILRVGFVASVLLFAAAMWLVPPALMQGPIVLDGVSGAGEWDPSWQIATDPLDVFVTGTGNHPHDAPTYARSGYDAISLWAHYDVTGATWYFRLDVDGRVADSDSVTGTPGNLGVGTHDVDAGPLGGDSAGIGVPEAYRLWFQYQSGGPISTAELGGNSAILPGVLAPTTAGLAGQGVYSTTFNPGILEWVFARDVIVPAGSHYNELWLGAQMGDNSDFVSDENIPSVLVIALDHAVGCPASRTAIGEQAVFSVDYTIPAAAALGVNDVVLTATVPAGTIFVNASNGGTESGGVITWNLGDLSPGDAGQVTYTLQVNTPSPLILDSEIACAEGLRNVAQCRAPGVVYVDADAPGAGTGLSWTDAFTEVQSALAATSPNDEIWVAEGVYYPDYDPGTGQYTGIVSSTFLLTNSVALYGGFGGYGVSETLRTQRDWVAYPTVLSGDMDRNDATDPYGVVTNTAGITGNNAWTVVTANGLDETAVLDGFIVTAGNANVACSSGFWDPPCSGGGMFNTGGSPVVQHVTFSGNAALDCGGGLFNYSNRPTLVDVTFSSNVADAGGGIYDYAFSGGVILTGGTFDHNAATTTGGGMLNYESNPVLSHVTFTSNTAALSGGGMANVGQSPVMTDVTFTGNTAQYGGGMENGLSTPTLVNVTFSGNHADYGGGMLNFYHSSPTLVNVVFSGNAAVYDGGGMVNDAITSTRPLNYTFERAFGSLTSRAVLTDVTVSLALINVTFGGNSAGGSGGGMYNVGVSQGEYDHISTPIIQNGVFDLNHDGSGMSVSAQIYNDALGTAIVSYTLVQGGCPTGATCDHVINADAQFVDANGPDDDAGTPDDNLRLHPASSAVDTGDNTALPLGTITDRDGNPRIVNDTVDMGAYEAQAVATLTLSAQPDTMYANGLDQATLTVTATDTSGDGTPFAGRIVTFTESLGSVNPVTAALDARGVATATYTAGLIPGTDTVSVAIENPGALQVATTTLTLQPNPIQGRLSSEFSSQLITYTFVVSNVFPALQEDVVLTGTVPAQTILITVTGGISMESSGQVYVVSPPTDLAEGERYTITWTVQVPRYLLGEIVAEARAESRTARLGMTAMDRIYRILLPRVYRNATK